MVKNHTCTRMYKSVYMSSIVFLVIAIVGVYDISRSRTLVQTKESQHLFD